MKGQWKPIMTFVEARIGAVLPMKTVSDVAHTDSDVLPPGAREFAEPKSLSHVW